MSRFWQILCGVSIFVCAYFSVLSAEEYEKLLNSYLQERGYGIIEGNISSRNTNQPLLMCKLLQETPSIVRIGEIGFNAGHSSLLFLNSHPQRMVYSFDIATHPYIHDSKKFIDEHFPGRHKLIEGDSTKTVPMFYKANPHLKFDFIFIDGGHQYEIALQDIQNMYLLASKDTIVVIDDTQPGGAVDRAVKQCKKDHLIKDDRMFISSDGSKAWTVCSYKYNS